MLIFYILYILLLLYVSSISINNFVTPIEWSEISLSGSHTSMSTILDSSTGSVYLCGGKISLFGKSSKCIRIEIERISNNLGFISYIIRQSFSGGSGLKASGPFPGLYLNAKAFTSESQNEGGIYNDRMCMLSISDGTNKPKCWCCDINNKVSSDNTIKCDDLQYKIKNGCPSRFEACVVHDIDKHIIYQIGGYYGTDIYDSILCFDLKTETYLTGNECNYGTLRVPMYGSGCSVISDGTIIVIGGLQTLSKDTQTEFSQSIDICKPDMTQCKKISIELDEGIYKTHVFVIDHCHIAIVGGTIKLNGFDQISDRIDIVNICTLQFIDKLLLPLPLSEMGIIKTNGALCLYGGVSFNQNTNLPQLSSSAYCTDLGFTKSPTTTSIPTINPTLKPSLNPTFKPTFKPTIYPTNKATLSPTIKPTSIPTIVGTGDVEFIDPTFSKQFVTFNQGMSGQTCSSDNQYLYICGGYSDGITSYNQCLIYNDNGDKISLPIYIDGINGNQLLLPMPSFYCKNECTAMYKNQLFFVNPTTTTTVYNNPSFYKCSIDLDDGHILCIDLCKDGKLQFCDDLINHESCITHYGQYLYISGGYDINGQLSDKITVFDMDPSHLDWISVPLYSFPTYFGYKSYFGQLSIPIASHSCSYWNNSLYIIGGKDISGFSTSSIQICSKSNPSSSYREIPETRKDCILSPISLHDARYNARSKVIGSSIITVCGAKSIDEFSSEIEIYDAFMDKFKSSSSLIDGARTACCLINWESKSKFVISGGEKWIGLKAQTIDNMIYSQYNKKPITSTIPSEGEEGEEDEILNCKYINVDTRDFSFKAIYNIYNKINNYYIFATLDKKAYLIIDATGIQKTWIYNYTEKTSCYYNNQYGDNGIPQNGPGLWTKPRTRYSQTHSILITLSCQNTMIHKINNQIILWGLTEAAFITIVVVGALIIITILMVGFCCWLKKTQRFKYKYNKQKQQQHEEEEEEEEEEDDGDDEEEEEEIGGGGTRILNNTNYVHAKSYSQINCNDISKTITIVRHEHSEQSQENIELQENNHCNISRIRSESNIETDDENNDENIDNDNEIIDDRSSSSTVNPHEVKFAANDKNTEMIDQIALEIKKQKKFEALNNPTLTIYRNEIDPKYKIQEVVSNNNNNNNNNNIETPSSQLLESGRTSSVEPVALNCPPPPPPVQATMFASYGDLESSVSQNNNNNNNNNINHKNKNTANSYSEDPSSILGVHNVSLNELNEFDGFTDISHPINPFQQIQTRTSALSVSKDNYAGHVNQHISIHHHQDTINDK